MEEVFNDQYQSGVQVQWVSVGRIPGFVITHC